MIDFELIIPDEEVEAKPKKAVKTWYNVNDIPQSEIKPFKKGYHPLNPYRLEDKVILHINHHDRFELIDSDFIGIKDKVFNETLVASVSEILGNNMVNISYWDTKPSVIKNVPVYSIRLAPEQNSLKTKIRVFFINLLRKIKNPNKLPPKIEAEVKIYWGR